MNDIQHAKRLLAHLDNLRELHRQATELEKLRSGEIGKRNRLLDE